MPQLVPAEPPPVTVDGVTLDGGELRAAATVVAEQVHGTRIAAVEASPRLETVVAISGCLLAGVVAVPVPPDSGAHEREHVLADSAAQLWLGRRRDDVDLPTIAVDLTDRSQSDVDEPTGGTALIMYTSGTTGPPKGAVLSRAAIAAGLDGLRDAWAWTQEDVLVHGLPLFHVHGLVLGVLGALRAGSRLVHTGRPTPSAYAEAGGSLYFGVPTVWGRIAADAESARALRDARLLVSGSAGLPRPVFAGLDELAGQGPVERYGMTETLITLAARADGPRRPGWVGGPIAGVEARIVDAEDGIGELEVRGTTLFDGYLGREDAPFTDDGWFRTGDSAAGEDGGYRIVGRTEDDLIKSGGHRVGAGEIEAALLEHPSVAEAAVVGEPDADLGQRIVAYVAGTSVDAQILIDHVATKLTRHKRPREVRVVDALPRNAMGKVQKSQLVDNPGDVIRRERRAP